MPDGWKVAIPSYHRSSVIVRHPLLEHAHVCVPPDQVATYQHAFDVAGRQPAALIARGGDSYVGAMNFILEQVWAPDEEFIFIIDDDTTSVQPMMSLRTVRVTDPLAMLSIIWRTFISARDAGAPLFGYARTPRPMERNSQQPFALREWVESGQIGFLDRTLRFDPKAGSNADIDLGLTAFSRFRIAWCDKRYAWLHGRWDQQGGGLADSRTSARMDEQLAYLQDKWGKDIVQANTGRRKTGRSLSIHVDSLRRRTNAD